MILKPITTPLGTEVIFLYYGKTGNGKKILFENVNYFNGVFFCHLDFFRYVYLLALKIAKCLKSNGILFSSFQITVFFFISILVVIEEITSLGLK